MPTIDDKTAAKALVAFMLHDAKASLEEQLLSQLEDAIGDAMLVGLADIPYELDIAISTTVPVKHMELLVSQVPEPMDTFV